MGTEVESSGAGQSLEVRSATLEPVDRNRLVVEHLPLVRRLCRKFSHSGEPLEDLIQVGTVGLIKATEKYDPDRGSEFPAFAVPVIVGEIKNYFRDHGWAVKVPRRLQRQRLAVEKAVEPLTQRLGRSPTIPELSAATGIPEEQVYDTFEVAMYGRPLSLDAEYDRNGTKEASCLLDYWALRTLSSKRLWTE